MGVKGGVGVSEGVGSRGGARAGVVPRSYLRKFDRSLLGLLRAGRKSRVALNGLRLVVGGLMSQRPAGVDVDDVLRELAAYNPHLWGQLREFEVGLSPSSVSAFMHVYRRYGGLVGEARGLMLSRSFSRLYEQRLYFGGFEPAVAVSDEVYEACPVERRGASGRVPISVDVRVKHWLEALSGGDSLGDVVEALVMRHHRWLRERAEGA